MDGMMMGMGVWALLLIVMLLAILVLVVLGSVWLFRNLRQGGPHRDAAAPRGETAQELLRRRYAAGEIDDEEYERRLAALSRR